MNCLVTGATGLIGFELCKMLLKNDATVFALSRKVAPARFEKLIGKSGFHPVAGDILDRDFLASFFAEHKIDFIFHMAVERHNSPQPKPHDIRDVQSSAAFRTNFLGTVNLLEAASTASIKGWIQSSAMVVYPFEELQDVPVAESFPPDPLEPNGFSVLLAENACRYYSRIGNFAFTILRYPGVFGVGKSNGMVAKIVKHCLSGNPEPIAVADDRSSDFVYSKDIASANLLALENLDRLNGKVYNVGSGQETFLCDLAEMIVELTNALVEIVKKPSGSPRRFFMNCELAHKDFGYTPRPIKQGLKDYIEDLKAQENQQQ